MPLTQETQIDAFISRWSPSGGRERANYQLFLTELSDLLELPHPEPAVANAAENTYTFDRAIPHVKTDGSSTTNFIDLYKANHFVLETKQGVENAQIDPTGSVHRLNPVPSNNGIAAGHGKRGTAGYDKAMAKAHAQAEGYIRDLPAADGRPPFLIVCDVGYVFELYAEFTQSGGRYQRFPDPKNHRIFLKDLAKPETRELLRTIWTDPLSLDPSKRIAKVTRDIADRLAKLAKSLEAENHEPGVVATFLQRCLFTMFAEDIGLLPKNGFLELLQKVDDNPASFPALITGLWKEMATGTDYSTVLMQKIAHFNGGLFEDPTALPLTREAVDLLIDAAKADWTEVDPAIFGTLLERALDPRERHKLGAHYTPRSYVERLIEPTVIAPLREQWKSVKAAAVLLVDEAKPAKAIAEVEKYHHHLCKIKVLDPACGSGNFLYVTLEHLKRLEAEVLDFFERIGGDRTLEMDSFKVRPDQFLGLEINPNAVSIAQLVLWIGYFQWHFRTTGRADTNDRPLLPKAQTIINQDAVLAYDEKIPRLDDDGNPLTIWDGLTTKPHPVTGKEVPDDTFRKPLYDYTNPTRPEWPEADYIVGNPPFVGASRMREVLGDGYTMAVRKAWKGDVPESVDFVMFWWQRSAELLRKGRIQRFGLITTNGIRQSFNRKVVAQNIESLKDPMSLIYAIPDHPWIDSARCAAVRISISVAKRGKFDGILESHVSGPDDEVNEDAYQLLGHGAIQPDLSIGVDITSTIHLDANRNIAVKGFELGNQGFLLPKSEANFLIAKNSRLSEVIHPYQNGNDLKNGVCDRAVIDFYGKSEAEAADYVEAFHHVVVNVKPNRSTNREGRTARNWWLFRRSGNDLRNATSGLDQFIATTRTAKHRVFQFVSGKLCAESKIVVIGSDDRFVLGVVSSQLHVLFATRRGGWLGVGNDPTYNHTDCFETFPFPDPDDETREKIRELGERLDAHRKRQQELHPDLTLTGIYNVLERLRADDGTPLTDKEKKIHDDGLVSVLKQIHDDLDEAVFYAYGWDDLWTWYREAEHGSIYDPDTDTTSQLEVISPKHLTEAVAEAHEKYDNLLLERLVALNHERAAEEKNGKIRWLRPEFQNPDHNAEPEAKLGELDIPQTKKEAAAVKKTTVGGIAPNVWPVDLPGQFAVIKKLVGECATTDPAVLSAQFPRKSTKRDELIAQIVTTLASLGEF